VAKTGTKPHFASAVENDLRYWNVWMGHSLLM